MMKIHMTRLLALTMALMLLLTSSSMALTLRYPQRGSDVTTLQTALRSLGYYTSTIDGIYGKGTRDAVKVFQADNGLSADGVAGPKTLSKLEALTGIQIGGSVPDEDTPTTTAGLFGGVYTTLSFGMKGTRVRTLQHALNELGYDVALDNEFGSATYMAVRAFQKATGLTVDGKAGKKTLQMIETYVDANGALINGPLVTPPETVEPEYAVPTRTLRYGMYGEDVRYTKDRLYALGYFLGERDGRFGSDTNDAVRAFQRMNGLTVDGVVGANTCRVLFSSNAIPADGKEPTPTPDRKSVV